MQQRRSTAADWESNNPVLALGEIGYVTDGNPPYIKIGDGINPWNDLDTIAGPPGPIGPAGPTGPTGPAVTGPTGPTGATGPTGMAAFYVSVTAPTAPNDGDGWFNSETAVTAIWYEDGDSGQWVEAGNSGPTGPTGPAGEPGTDGGTVVLSETSPDPATSADGSFWFETTTGRLYVLYVAGSSRQWVENL